MKKRKGSSVIILVFSIFALLGLASFVLDLGLILNQRYELQKAVESAALISASEFEIYEQGNNFRVPNSAQITDPATGNAGLHYRALLDTNQVIQGISDTPTITLNRASRAVRVRVDADVSTYFLSALGVKTIRIRARAAAVNMPVFLSSRFPVPTGSILNGNGTYFDTEIKQPLGGTTTDTARVFNQNVDFDNIYGPPDGLALSLGPGGYITLKLPATLVDGKGFDFAIHERGHAEGYYVYAGIDKDLNDPYVDALNPGGGIHWVNVSCTGVPLHVNKNEFIGSFRANVLINGISRQDYRFYGSGFFDLGSKCTSAGTVIYDGTGGTAGAPRISNVKYLKIIDDNREDGFLIQPHYGLTNPPSAIPMLIPGEHSTFTPGADMDAIEIFHHSRLISLTDFSTDTDSDGLIDVLERMYGFDPNSANTDGEDVDDAAELWGYNPVTGNSVEAAPSQVLFRTVPDRRRNPPVMRIEP